MPHIAYRITRLHSELVTCCREVRRVRAELPRESVCDAASNRTRLTYPDSSYITYEYDGLNRLTAVKNSSGTALAQYAFDWRSRRERVNYANNTRIEYLYDVAGRMISVKRGTVTYVSVDMARA